MKRKSLLLLLLLALGAPWAALGQTTFTLNGNLNQTLTPGTTYTFYDSGGSSGNYANNESYTAVFTCAGSNITINFSQWSTSTAYSNYDYMYIYDGPTSGTQLAYGATEGSADDFMPTGQNITATSGTMTITWKSDVSTNTAGWTATITVTSGGGGQGGDSNQVTVNDGTTTNSYVPIYGLWVDDITKSQFIIPATGLSSMQYGTIDKLTFYSSNTNINWGSAKFEVYMTETNTTTLSTLADYSTMTKVKNAGSLSISNGQMVVTLDTPYQYMGGNLMIGFLQTSSGSYSSCSWYGISASSASMGGYGSSISQQNFLPKTTFDYTPGEAPSCIAPTLEEVDPQTIYEDQVSLRWTKNGNETWVLQYSTASDFTNATSVDINNGLPVLILHDLTPATTYYVRVKAICGAGDESNWSNVVTFRTACGVITSFPWTENFENTTSGSPNIPECWERIVSYESSYSTYPYVYSSSSSAHGGSNYLYMYSYYAENIIALPEMSAINTLQISLWARASSTIPEAFEVGYVKNGTFTALQQYTLTSTYQKFTAYLTEAPDDAERIAIRSYHSTSSSTVYVDDITVKVAVNLPTQIVASNPGDNQMTWAQFVDFVNNQAEDFQGLTVTLMDNITVNTMVGTADHPFSGTFDGNNKNLDVDISSDEQGAAPFRYISGATIKRLVVTGYVTATAHHASGLVGFCAAGSTNKIENCLVHTSVTNNNAYNGDNGNNFIGGLIGHNLTATTTIEGCVYDGTLNSQGFKGGMVGFGDYNSNVVIKDSYFNGSYSTNGYADPNFSPIACHGSGRNFNFTFSNFYYNTEAGTFTAPNYEGTVNASYSTSGRAKLAHFITAVSPAEVFFGGDIVSSYTVSSLNAYATGIVYGALIAGEGDQVALTLSGSSTGVYETSCGTLNGSTLTMDDCDAVISAVTCPAPIGLAASNITGHIVDLNWVGYSDSYNVLYGALDAQGTVLETGFEDGQIPAAFTNDANHRWKVTSSGANNSSYCAIPGNKGVDSSDSDLAFEVIGPGAVSFIAKVSSESGYDYGRFLIDGAQEVNISGTQDWTLYSFELTAGSHTLVWRYHKDGSSYSGEDLFYVDDITVVGLMVGEWHTVTVDEATATLTDLEPETLYEAKVQGVCDGDEMSNPSETITFTTLEACPVPYNLAIPSIEITANSAFLTWVGESDSYNVSWGVDGEVITLVDENFSSSIPAGWTNDATYPWTIVNGHIQSGNTGVTSSTSAISIGMTLDADGTIEFDAECRGEGTYTYWDHCDFYIDDTRMLYHGADITGEGFQHYSYNVTAGQHNFTWSYTKDSSTDPDGDYFAVDNVKVSCQGIDWSDPVSVATTEYNITGLAPSTKYYVKVTGVCDGTETDPSDIRNFTTGSGYQVSVSVNNSAMGSASIFYNGETVDSPASISPDTEVTVTAVPGDGFVFVNWTEPNSETGAYDVVVSDEAEYSFTPVGNRDLRANFAAAHHTLTIVAAYGTVEVNGTPYIEPIEIVEGGEVYVELSDWGDYQFSGWTVDGTGSEMEEPALSGTTFTMGTTNTVLTANFDFEEICFEAGEGTSYEISDHWFLFTSPLSVSVNPSDVYGLFYEEDPTSVFYDLYCFDQTEELEWRNWKESEENGGHFDLEAGKGYLYANGYADVELCFTGEPYNGNGNITITNIPDNNWAGWNLVGNPYNCEMYSSMSYYAMNNDGDNGPELVSRTTDISLQPMEGFFVYCESGTGTVSLSTTAPNAKHTSLSLNISRGRGLVDRAIITFSNGNTLPKFQLNPNHTKVYIPKDEKDYAVVNAESEMGEMPVSFKAEKSGTYTISANADGVSFGYLHLIDNKTGADVDLLANASYTFDALATDYASRFKLVFATGSSTGSDAFAFYSNGNWIINNEGNATLQVVDVNGRVLSSEQVSGCVSKQINAAPGVYMLRLMNGEKVKVQKVVVR